MKNNNIFLRSGQFHEPDRKKKGKAMDLMLKYW